MLEPIIKLEKITVNFDGFNALEEVNFSMDYKELRTVIGPNGAGKTTLLDVISGKVKPEKGRVIFKGKDISKVVEYHRAVLGIGRKFQTPTVFDNLSLFENMELALPKAKGIFSTFGASLKNREKDKIFFILKKLNLEDRVYEKAGILAHGEKQWLELGMSIVQEPALLLVDEPVAGMTGKEREKTGELLQMIAIQRSVLVIEHDMEFVRRIAKKVTVLHQGRVLCEGSVDEVQNNPIVIDVYLGRAEEG